MNKYRVRSGLTRTFKAVSLLLFGCGFLVMACAPPGIETGTGGSGAGTGGTTSSGSGGSTGSGGAPTGSGGSTTGTGGQASTTGGTTGSGGATTGSGGRATTGGTTGSGGATTGTGGQAANTGGTTGTGGGSAAGGTGGRGTGGGAGRGTGGSGTGGAGTGGTAGAGARFSFFMTSLVAMRRESGSQNGFGGDLRFGETTGLAGADKLCAKIAEASMAGAGAKTWRAFLSVVGPPVVNAIDRVGAGPWYDRMGRLVAANKADLMQQRPKGADPQIINDLPNEFGVPNHNPDGTGQVDNHDVLTGTGPTGNLYSMNTSNTCNDWTSSAATAPTGGAGGSGGGGGFGLATNGPWCGHSWPAISGMNWMSALAEGGCGAGINLVEQGPPMQGVYTVGTGGGYGGIYCLATTP